MKLSTRFQDENLLLSHFYQEVCVVCPACFKKANATVNKETKTARLICESCSCNKEITTISGNCTIEMPANQYFEVELWLQAPFKNDIFWAYNSNHLEYLERYISATIREHKDRTGFTLLEKLPKFYHEAKNRESLLKIIRKLKSNAIKP